MNGHTPDINAKATVAGAAITTIVVWLLSLFSIVMDGEVATSLTTLLALGFGLLWGDNSNNRRSTDPPTPTPTPTPTTKT